MRKVRVSHRLVAPMARLPEGIRLHHSEQLWDRVTVTVRIGTSKERYLFRRWCRRHQPFGAEIAPLKGTDVGDTLAYSLWASESAIAELLQLPIFAKAPVWGNGAIPRHGTGSGPDKPRPQCTAYTPCLPLLAHAAPVARS